MPSAKALEIRLYCICGQKMKVNASMLGRNGKCVACRQKIRIPRADELPPGGGPIYLKDHKEFLRRPTLRLIKNEDTEDPIESDELSLAGEPERVQAVPLDVLTPLQQVCSLELKLEKQFESLRRSGKSAGGMDKATLMRYRGLVRQARHALEEELRLRLLEVSEQLGETNDEIARVIMALRLGQLDHERYFEQLRPLRQRRERLERRKQNLRGWLATTDPYVAGGALEISLDDTPVQAPEITFPMELGADRPLVQEYADRLRAALTERDEAERRATELRKMQDEGGLDAAGSGALFAENEALQTRARAAVAYYRSRFEQCLADFEQENMALLAYLDVLRGRMVKGELDKRRYQDLELELLRAQQDLSAARDLAKRAIAAGTGREVPMPPRTLVARLTHREGAGAFTLDYYLALIAAALLIVNIVVPLYSKDFAGNQIFKQKEIAFGLFIACGILCIAAHLPRRETRGMLLNGIWAVFSIAMAFFVSEAWYATDAVGAALRAEPRWYAAPGIFMLAASGLAMGAAGFAALIPLKGLWRVPVVSALIVAVSISAILSDVWGRASARPALRGPEFDVQSDRAGLYDVRLTVANSGGWRSFWVGANSAQAPTPFQLLVEKKIGVNSWQDMGKPIDVIAPPQRGSAANAGRDAFEVAAGQLVPVRYALPSGIYRVLLKPLPHTGGYTEIQREFDLPEIVAKAPESTPPPQPQPSEAAATPEAAPETAPETAPDAAAPAVDYVEVRLRGIINPGGHEPRFVIEVHDPARGTDQRRISLGETIYGDWQAKEFNPNHKSLTIGNGAGIYVLESGQSMTLAAPPPAN